MARTRRLPVTLIACLVSSLLISNYADGETIKNSPTLLDKLRASSEYDASRTSSPALDRGLPLEETAASVRPLPEDPQSDELLVKEQAELESKEINSVKSTVSSLQKVSAVVNEVQETTSSPHVTGTLTGERNTEDNVYSSNLEKSSSTQTILDESQKLDRTKDAASSLTTKPILEETSMRRNDSQEKTSQQEVKDYDTAVEATTAKLSSQEFAPKKMNANTERSLSLKLESTTESSANIEKKENLKEEKSEDVFPRKELHEDTRGENEVSELESKHSEVQDLEKVEKKEDGWSISLINDTNVNYKSGSSTDGDFRSNSESRGLENNTNSISGDDAMIHERVGPKEEVEVVKNVTQSPIQKMLDGSKQRLSTPEGNEPGFNPEASDKQRTPGVNTGTLQDEKDKPEEITGKVEDGRLGVENGTSRNNEEEQTISSPEGNPNLVPRGRTIAFSGVNEFPSLETKTTTVTAKEIDLPSTKKNTSTDKSSEQKPYPYLKSTREPVIESSLAINSHGGKSVEVENSTTEESPAFENTIVRGDTEKKIIVTEPSVVLENSIQQFKPADQSEKSENESSNNSTSSQISSSTTLIVPDVVSRNGTQDKKAPNESIVGSTEAESMSANGNDVPEGSEVSEVITSKDDSFDVTGNGITEVSPKPKTTDKEDSYKNPFVLVNGTTELPLTTSTEDSSKMGSNADVQTDAEESLLMRSTLNVTEVSTQLPFTLDTSQSMKMAATTVSINSNTPEPENTTIAPMILSNSTDQSPMTVKDMIAPSESPRLNATDEIPSKVGNVTGISDEDQSKISDENLMITTTGVEYEFVGLTEATTILNGNTTEQIVKENSTELPTTGLPKMTIIPEVLGISTKEYNIEEAASTIVPESVTDNPPGTNAIESTMAYETTTLISTDETPAGRTMPVFTTEFKMKDSTVPVIENQTEKGLIKDQEDVGLTGSTYSWSITTESQTMVTVINTENPLDSHQAKDVTTITEVANTKLGSTPMVETTTVARVHESDDSTSSPFVPNSLPPKVLPPSTSTESPIKDTTDLNQNLSPDEITSLVQIVVKGTSYDVCPELDALKAALAKLLTIGAKESVSAEQIIIHQNPCLEPQPPMATPAETPLISILVYIVDSNGKFDSAKTNMLPSLYNTTNISFPVTIHSFLLVQEKDSGNAIAVVVVSSVAFICLVLLAGLLFIMRKRQTRFNYGERCRPVSLDAYSLDNVSAYNSVRRKGAVRSSKRSYGNPTFEDSSAIPSHPLNFASLSSFCNDTNAINEEFTGIPQVSAKMDELPTGAEVKNRYANVIPLPETRVPLQKINNDPLTEYINASYVRGPRNATRYYIACQAPMESTVTDFWRMIWEQQSKVIIMLTDLVENDVEKCSEYIPPSEVTDCHRLYGDFQVTLKKRETKEKYAISTLHLKNLENNTFREVYHIWYLWPVNGVQSDGAGLIAVILEARALQRAGPGPIVVHCSPGTGRTGTLIALDLGIRQYEITRTVDVPRVVYTIRRDRAGAVQTKEQYAFIYKALNLYATKLAGGGGLEST